jgi:hypothetical protein
MEQQWLSATIKCEEGEVLARFAYQYRELIRDSSYTRSAWFQLEAIPTAELDDYLRDLDELEDAVRRGMENCYGCHMLLALTGAGYRDLVFAMRDDAAEAEQAIQLLEAAYPDRLDAKVFQSPKFGPYAALVSRVKEPI